MLVATCRREALCPQGRSEALGGCAAAEACVGPPGGPRRIPRRRSRSRPPDDRRFTVRCRWLLDRRASCMDFAARLDGPPI
jgi:hypothetical protein